MGGFELIPTEFFLKQVEDLGHNGRMLIQEKLLLAKQNPFRYKRIKWYNLFLFRIRFEELRKEKRIIYLVDKKYAKVLCLLDRNNEHKDLSSYLKKLGYH